MADVPRPYRSSVHCGTASWCRGRGRARSPPPRRKAGSSRTCPPGFLESAVRSLQVAQTLGHLENHRGGGQGIVSAGMKVAHHAPVHVLSLAAPHQPPPPRPENTVAPKLPQKITPTRGDRRRVWNVKFVQRRRNPPSIAANPARPRRARVEGSGMAAMATADMVASSVVSDPDRVRLALPETSVV